MTLPVVTPWFEVAEIEDGIFRITDGTMDTSELGKPGLGAV